MRKAFPWITLFLCTGALAQAASEQPLPFVNDHTILYTRAQADRIDMGQIEKFILDSAGAKAASKPVDFDKFQKALHEQFGTMERWLAEFKEAGGHEIDMVGQSNSIMRGGGVVVIPIDPQSNPQQIMNLMTTGHKTGAASRPKQNGRYVPDAEIISGKAVVFGVASSRSEMTSIVPGPNPEISAAITASKDSPEIIVLAPDAGLRQHLLQFLPPQIVMLPTAPIVNGIMWIEQYATMPPEPSEHLIIQTKDAATAQQISQLINMGLAMMQMMSDQQLGSAQNRALLMKLLTPQLKGDRVEINLNSAQLAELAPALVPWYMNAVQQNLRVVSASHERQILVAFQMYRNDHNGQWPAALDDVKTQFGDAARQADVLSNPRDPQRKPAYIYLKPKTPIAQESQLMVLYESHEKFSPGVYAGFADGHVEFVSNAQHFKDLLLQSYQENSPDQ